MQPDRLWGDARWEVHGVGRLRRGNTLTTSIAPTASGIFPQAAPQRTVRQSSLAQAHPDGERGRTMVHGVLLAAPQAAHQAALSACAFPMRRATCVRVPKSPFACLPGGADEFRAGRNPAQQLALVIGVLMGKCGSALGKPVICDWLVTFRLVCLGRDALVALPSGQLSSS